MSEVQDINFRSCVLNKPFHGRECHVDFRGDASLLPGVYPWVCLAHVRACALSAHRMSKKIYKNLLFF
ncbi:hypothetical protein AcV7_008495 [Taiwanofungus camphoratus]|nr:hypothetical protein AcV7_008495 [Antrodia cinnamomea]